MRYTILLAAVLFATQINAQEQLKQTAYIKASNPHAGDHFGCGGVLDGHTGNSVAVSAERHGRSRHTSRLRIRVKPESETSSAKAISSDFRWRSAAMATRWLPARRGKIARRLALTATRPTIHWTDPAPSTYSRARERRG